uniref:DNA ligase (NAD(+)) n=1 Tax=Mimivirus LCMiAC02 TaxID=2506609 RepID=A0A481Z0W5_9VIRU|nr:MAG: NAD-dependent DNA ligase [Mimivirus LCMiAC02]
MSNKIGSIKELVKELEDPYNYANKITITKLVKILRKLSFQYYNKDKPLVPDKIYDILRNVLEKRDSKHPFLSEIGAPITKEKVKLPYYMPSLDKIKPDTNKINNWLKKYEGPYVLSDKLDGVSALLILDEEDEFKMYTRGDGEKGQDISHLIPYIIPKTLKPEDLPENVAIRGELIMSKKKFKKISKEYKIMRTTVSSVVNSINFNVKLAKMIDFVAYAVLNPKYKQKKQMKKLTNWNILTVKYKVKKEIDYNMLSKYLIKRREEGKYEIDGIVVIDSSDKYDVTKRNPKYGFAFKTILMDQIAETTVLDVEWNVSVFGLLKPKIKVEPIVISGTTIRYATAHNAKYVVKNVLGPGAIIKIIRSGDVIPKIIEVMEPAASGKPMLPSVPYKWNETKVDLIAKDIHGATKDNIIIKQIARFFKILDVKYIGIGIVKKLVNAGYKDPITIISTDEDDIAEIIGEKLTTKIFKNIRNAFKTVSLIQLMVASNTFGRGFGMRKIKKIVDAYPNIMKNKWNKNKFLDKITELEGFNTKTATNFVNKFNKFKKFYDKLNKVVDLKHVEKTQRKKTTKTTKPTKPTKTTKTDKKLLLSGEKIVFTGYRPDKDLEKLVEELGGKVMGSVSGKTTMLVYVIPTGGKLSGKYTKAQKLGIKMMTKEAFEEKYIK